MKLNTVIIYVITFSFFFANESFGDNSKMKPLYTVLVCNHETSFETFNGGLSYQIIKTQKVKEALETKSIIINQDEIDFNRIDYIVYPNPVDDFAALKFKLSEDALINIYSVDNFNNKQIHYSGLKEIGDQTIQINFDSVQKGLVLLYLEINGRLSVYKVINN